MGDIVGGVAGEFDTYNLGACGETILSEIFGLGEDLALT